MVYGKHELHIPNRNSSLSCIPESSRSVTGDGSKTILRGFLASGGPRTDLPPSITGSGGAGGCSRCCKVLQSGTMKTLTRCTHNRRTIQVTFYDELGILIDFYDELGILIEGKGYFQESCSCAKSSRDEQAFSACRRSSSNASFSRDHSSSSLASSSEIAAATWRWSFIQEYFLQGFCMASPSSLQASVSESHCSSSEAALR